ncbi:MAG: UvrD-helicase domain-containing protein [Chromatiaceae bacterium]|nr:UvrD-helicase domain-containing protein [Chromatiaceae bacterium]
MEFRIADTFTDSLARLSGQEQKAVKTTAFDLQLNPASPGMQFHKLNKSKDPDFWSVRASDNIRLIVHKTAASLLLCYVDHHDAAYAWAERRKIERHPKTGAAQLVTVRERVEEVPVYAQTAGPATGASATSPKPLLFSNLADDELLAYGVPADWLDAVRGANEDSLLELADDLPQEAAEALIDLAVGVTPQVAQVAPPDADPFAHPDAQRRFRLLTDVAELERAFDYPWEKWTVFLHPAQRQFVERDYNGPARISGSAGTGKTIVGLHRAVLLAKRHPSARILLTTFSSTLANALRVKLDRLTGGDTEVRRRIRVESITEIGLALYDQLFGTPRLATETAIRATLADAAAASGGHGFSSSFLYGEWSSVVNPWQIRSWEGYRDVARLGRKTRIGGKQREQLWAIFERVIRTLEASGTVTWSALFTRLAEHLKATQERPFDFAVVDEAQDIGIAELRFLAALGTRHPASLFFTGDLGQRIFQQPFSWKALGVDVRGRSHTLRINYRTSHPIRAQADRLLPSAIADVDGIEDSGRGTQSVFNGPPPEIQVFDGQGEEVAAVATWIGARVGEGILPHEIGVFVRSEDQLDRAKTAVQRGGAQIAELRDTVDIKPGHVAVGTMHLAKGLEFRAVAVMACDDEVLPLQERIESITDDSDLEEVYNTERHLLYVACTRARDRLLITGVDPVSEFLEDMR